MLYGLLYILRITNMYAKMPGMVTGTFKVATHHITPHSIAPHHVQEIAG